MVTVNFLDWDFGNFRDEWDFSGATFSLLEHKV
jgi:hypothetical protein